MGEPWIPQLNLRHGDLQILMDPFGELTEMHMDAVMLLMLNQFGEEFDGFQSTLLDDRIEHVSRSNNKPVIQLHFVRSTIDFESNTRRGHWLVSTNSQNRLRVFDSLYNDAPQKEFVERLRKPLRFWSAYQHAVSSNSRTEYQWLWTQRNC